MKPGGAEFDSAMRRRPGAALALACVLAIWAGPAWADALGAGIDALYRGDRVAAMRHLEPLARDGNAQAAYGLAQMYEGIGGTDYRRAMLWYQRAAANGSVDAVVALALMYKRGDGVPKDIRKSLSLFIQAANMGNITAQFDLGLLYSDEDEGVVNYPKAYLMFTLASAAEQRIPVGFRPSDFRKKLAEKMAADQLAEAERLISEMPATTSVSPASGD